MNGMKKMENGLPYKCDSSIQKAQFPIKILVRMYNKTMPFNIPRYRLILKAMGIEYKGQIHIEPPFRCEYGKHIEIGSNFYANSGCIMLDAGRITIGNDVLLGPHVYLFTSGHPMYPAERAEGYEISKPITIGDNVWIGGNTVVCAGVTIGKNSVIGAGSVVTRDIPENVFAAGNPCKVIKEI